MEQTIFEPFNVAWKLIIINFKSGSYHFLWSGTPRDIKYNNVKVALESIEGVVAAHSLHIWSLTVNKAALAVHLAIGVCACCWTILGYISVRGQTGFWSLNPKNRHKFSPLAFLYFLWENSSGVIFGDRILFSRKLICNLIIGWHCKQKYN